MKKTHLLSIVAFGALFISTPFMSHADTVVRTGDSISVEKDQKIDGDFYTAGSILNISGEVAGDLAAVGGKNTLNGKVSTDALMAGGNVDVHGAIGDDLRIIAGDAIIAEPVTGDVFVIAGTVKVLSTASIGGDLLVYGGNAEVSGSVGGDIQGTVSNLRIDAPVAGNIDVVTDTLTLGDRADVAGSVRYVSAAVLARSQNAKVSGEITRNDQTKEEEAIPAKSILVPVLMVLFSMLVWYLVARRYLSKVVDRALTRSVRPITTGFIVFFATPVLAVILIVTILGGIVGVTALIGYILLVLLALIASTAVIGQGVMRLMKKHTAPLSPVTIGLGILVVTVLAFVPFVGPAVIVAAFLLTLGAMIDLLLHRDTP